MSSTFNIHIAIGNTRIVLKGATSYLVNITKGPALIAVKAPVVGRTIYALGSHNPKGEPLDLELIVHEIPDDEPEKEGPELPGD